MKVCLLSEPIHTNNSNRRKNRIITSNVKGLKEISIPVYLRNEKLDGYLVFIDKGKGGISDKITSLPSNNTLTAKYTFNDILHQSSLMKKTILKAKQYAKSNAPVLIFGESGTGKELIAHSIHNYSHRRKKPFLPVNCSAIPKHILESELFGYEEGAFTGAKKGGKPGFFELAQGGTIFLDEIAEIPLELQAKLLRVLQEQEVIRLGGEHMISLDVRVITATNKSLPLLIETGELREDLYYRINVLQVNIPSLNQRKEDILVIFEHILMKHGMSMDQAKYLVNIGKKSMMSYDWPGNIRELENFVLRLTALSPKDSTNYDLAKSFSDVFNDFISYENSASTYKQTAAFNITLMNLESERQKILDALQEVDGNKMKAAKKLGISRTTLWRKMKELNIN